MVKFQGTTLPQKLSPEEMQKAVLDLLSKVNTTYDAASSSGDLASTILAGLSSFPSAYQGSMFSLGTNSSGTYLKFANGSMVCYGVKSGGAVGNASAGPLYVANTGSYISVTFPATFVGTPYPYAQANDDSSTAFAASSVPSQLTTTGCAFYLFRATNVSASYSFQWIAWGYWQ